MVSLLRIHHFTFIRTRTIHKHVYSSHQQGLTSILLSAARRSHSMASVESLRDEWNNLYRVRLPSLAKTKDPVQEKWPVNLDHCFARIILDNVIGKDRPWNKVLKSPAYKNMDEQQLRDAIALGEKLATGEENLVALDEKSLAMRGKKSKQAKSAKTTSRGKRKANVDDDADTEQKAKRVKKTRRHSVSPT